MFLRESPLTLRVACLVFAAIVVAACTNPMRETAELIVAQYQKPSAEANFPDGACLAPTTPIVVQFTESMDPATLELAGLLAPHSDGGVWSATTSENDTLTISPKSTWPLGSGASLTVRAADTDAYLSDEVDVTYGVLDGVIYVHAETGSDANPGTVDLPRRSIPRAIEAAEAVFDAPEVRVAGGTYQVVTSAFVQKSTTVRGGYDPQDWSIRDPLAYPTHWEDIRTGTTGPVALMSPLASGTVTPDGLRISAPNNAMSASTTALFANAGALALRAVTLETGTAGESKAISIDGASLTMEDSTFLAASAEGTTIFVYASDSTVTVRGSTFTGAMLNSHVGLLLDNCSSRVEQCIIDAATTAYLAIALHAEGGSLTVRNNVISAGTMLGSDVAGQYGIQLRNISAVIQNNTIDGGTGSSTLPDDIMVTGIYLWENVSSRIENNVVFTGAGDLQTGIWQGDAASFPTVFENNNMHACEDGNYFYEPSAAGYVSSAATLESFLSSNGTSASGNSFEDAVLAASDLRPTASSPASVRTGGKDLSGEFTVDLDGATRTTADGGWSMGAYEY